MTRRTWIAGIILAVQLILIAVLLWPRAKAAAPGPLLANLDPAQVTGVTLEDSGGTRTLSKVSGKWVLPDAGNFPVNEVSVSSLLTNVVKIDTSRLVASTPSSHDRLKVGEKGYVRKITLTTGDGVNHTFYLGSSPTTRATHVRLDGNNNVYLTPALQTSDVRMEANAWIDPTYLQAPPERQQRLTLKNGQGEFVLAKGADGNWSMDGLAAGESVDSAKVTGLAGRLGSLAMLEPLGVEPKVEYGMEPPTATVTVELTPTNVVTGATAAPETVTLQIGAKRAADNSYVVKSSGSDYYVAVTGATLDPFVHDGRSDLVTTPVVTETAPLTGALPLTPSFEVAPVAPVPTPP